ncbi:MAG: amidohydrolase family protein, partial [Candidatus Eremiobacteraeota bacterium]|nr:amidohydrolase family protein [Candidatus Eremiobacteraeota bacterium]
MFDMIIKGGKVVTSGICEIADIGIRGEKITALGDLSPAGAGTVFSATGLLVLPGIIDAHVHFHLPVGRGIYSADDFFTGGRSALTGGVTTVIDFVHPEHGEDLFEALENRLGEASDCPVDYGLFYCINENSRRL